MIKRLLVFIFLFGGSNSLAVELTPSQVYIRCFTAITGVRPGLYDNNFQRIEEEGLDPIEACINFLDAVQFDASSGVLSPNNPRNRMILKHFQNFHASGFTSKSTRNLFQTYSATMDAYDVAEPALHISRALFYPGAKYSDVVKRNKSLEAIRINENRYNSNGAILSPVNGKDDLSDYSYRNANNENVPWTQFRYIKMGELKGIRDATNLNIPLTLSRIPYVPDQNVNRSNVNLFRSYGGGVLGSPSFLLLNTKYTFREASNGGEKMHRNWSKAIFEDLLCNDVPSLKPEDVAFFTRSGSDVAFRKSRSCTVCHAQLDLMAGNARNIVRVVSNFDGANNLTEIITTVKQNLSGSTWPVSRDDNFSRKPTSGQLFFRNYNGNLKNIATNNIQDLGNKIVQQNDYYICAAKKYYKFLTGIDVDIRKPTADREISSINAQHRDKVIELGLELKSTQSLKTLIKSILRLPNFKQSNYGAQNNE